MRELSESDKFVMAVMGGAPYSANKRNKETQKVMSASYPGKSLVYKQRVLNFTEKYSRVLAVAFGFSAFLFNMGADNVLKKKSLIIAGIAVVITTVLFLLYYDNKEVNNDTSA